MALCPSAYQRLATSAATRPPQYSNQSTSAQFRCVSRTISHCDKAPDGQTSRNSESTTFTSTTLERPHAHSLLTLSTAILETKVLDRYNRYGCQSIVSTKQCRATVTKATNELFAIELQFLNTVERVNFAV